MKKDEFYIGYAKKAPKRLSWFIALTIVVCSSIILCYSAVNHFLRVPFHTGVSHPKTVTLKGVFVAKPYPMLLTQRKGKPAISKKGKNIPVRVSRYYLTPPGKKGLGKAVLKWDGKYVSVKGKLIYRNDQTMVVIKKSSLKEIKKKKGVSQKILNASVTNYLGTFVLKGEIVDSKCYLGQMQPGAGKTHRACATLCIRGGLAPIFITKIPKLSSRMLYLTLISPENQPVNQQILDLVAEPIEIKGEIIRKDNLYFLKADPKEYKRISVL